jgi:hypothetical protein
MTDGRPRTKVELTVGIRLTTVHGQRSTTATRTRIIHDSTRNRFEILLGEPGGGNAACFAKDSGGHAPVALTCRGFGVDSGRPPRHDPASNGKGPGDRLPSGVFGECRLRMSNDVMCTQ